MMKGIMFSKTVAVAALVAVMLAAPVAHARQVVMCTLNWEPYYGENLPRQGFFTDLVRSAFARSGHEVRTQFMPWARALLEVEQGDRDVLLGAYYTDERAKTYFASDSIYTDQVGLIALKSLGVEDFDSLRDLTEYRIGHGRGFSVNEEFDSADYLQKEPEENEVLNVRKLFAGRIDMIAGSFANIRFIAQQQDRDLSELVFLEPVLKEHTLHIMISRSVDDGEQLLADFHDGLKSIREDGTYDRILTEMGYK